MDHLNISTRKKISNVLKKFFRMICTPFQSVVPDFIRNRFPFFGTVCLKGLEHPCIEFYTHGQYGTDRIALKLARHGISGYELETTRVLLHLAKKANRILDVGANTGCFALLSAAINPHSQVIAFEAVPFIYQMLMKNVKLNHFNNLIAHDLVVSDMNGYTKFYVTRTRVGIPTDSSMRQGFRDQIEEMNLKTTTLDDYIKYYNIGSVDILKIDVESTEDKVIRGGLQTIQRDLPFIICEVLKNVDHSYIQNTLQALGYEFYHITLAGLKYHGNLQGSQGVNERNYLFVPKNKKNVINQLII